MLGGPGIRQKRRMFFVSIYGVLPTEEYTILKVTQETTAQEIIQQALQKAGKTEERVDDYVLVEDVHRGWDKQDIDKPGQQQILDPGEKLLQAQNKWKGSGKFVLRKKGDDPSSRAWMTTMVKEQKRRCDSSSTEMMTPDWDSTEQTFLVCIHNVSADQPYTIIQAPVSSTAQDIITQAIVRARRREDPANYVLVEELCITSVDTPSKARRPSTKTERRVLGDEEQVYPVQHHWNLPGKFVLLERDKVPEQEKKRKSSRSPFHRLSLASLGLGKDKKDKSKPDTEDRRLRRFHAARRSSRDHYTTTRPHSEAQFSTSLSERTPEFEYALDHNHGKTKSATLPRKIKLLSKKSRGRDVHV